MNAWGSPGGFPSGPDGGFEGGSEFIENFLFAFPSSFFARSLLIMAKATLPDNVLLE
jgi:hypothetical protein